MIKQACVMMDLEGTSLSQQEQHMLAHPLIGGVILFSRNFVDSEQLINLIKSVRSAARHDIIIAVDNEGGRVQRFKTDGFTPIPAMGKLAPYFMTRPELDKANDVSELAWLLASECLAHDIDVSFAPVLDLERGSDVIGDRSFNCDIDIATEYARYWCKGFAAAGMKSIGKHFPGHGSTKEDSHIAAPRDERSFEQIRQNDLRVFTQLIQSNQIQGVMPAHVIFSNVDSQPVGYSRYWLQNILKQSLNFDGVIFSDDLSMVGAGAHLTYTEKAQKAIEAGCDMVLICNNKDAVQQVLSNIDDITPASSKALMLRSSHKIALSELQQTPRWQKAVTLAKSINEVQYV